MFKFVLYNLKVYISRIFNFRLVNKVKGKLINLLYKKLQLIISVYNNKGKEVI